jgi:hypothetical protein
MITSALRRLDWCSAGSWIEVCRLIVASLVQDSVRPRRARVHPTSIAALYEHRSRIEDVRHRTLFYVSDFESRVSFTDHSYPLTWGTHQV